MNPELLSYLRASVPQMPPDIAWPLMNQCANFESMDDVPKDVCETINKYLPDEFVRMVCR